jgi:hypothetical protein
MLHARGDSASLVHGLVPVDPGHADHALSPVLEERAVKVRVDHEETAVDTGWMIAKINRSCDKKLCFNYANLHSGLVWHARVCCKSLAVQIVCLVQRRHLSLNGRLCAN